MKLTELLSHITPEITDENGLDHPVIKEDPDIGSIHYDSRDVQPGGLFVAISGFVSDGHDYIDAAVEKGAIAVIAQQPVDTKVPVIKVENTRKALASLSSGFYHDPSEKLVVIGITGTNGKTTITYLLESILTAAGYATGVIGTINYRYAGKIFDNPRTTPESLDLQRILSEMRSQNITHVIIEVASHGIELHRVDHTWLDVGVFTNITQDHLDFHGDMDTYWACKKKLFTHLLRTGPKKEKARAVINTDDPKGKELMHSLDLAMISVGTSENNAVFCKDFNLDLTGISGTISTPDGNFTFSSDLTGEYNLENILCAAGVGIALKLSPDKIKKGIQTVTGIPGRLERIQNNLERYIFVDYAHTPDALENVLIALQSLATRKIICVFGCGGDRDQGKRPKMGAIAGRLSDLAIITSDNPRTEPPLKIIEQILEGTRSVMSYNYTAQDLEGGIQQSGYIIEPDREKAITMGIRVSQPGDIVLIAGKGHETYQILGTRMVPFDDRIVAERALTILN